MASAATRETDPASSLRPWARTLEGFDTLTEQTRFRRQRSAGKPRLILARSKPPSKLIELQPVRPDASNDCSGAAAR
jgi:hypothetical protein